MIRFYPLSLVSVLWLFIGCVENNRPAQPLIARPSDLLRSYREQPESAKEAYHNLVIVVPLTAYTSRGNEVHWFVGASTKPPAIIFRFQQSPNLPADNTTTIWISGTCRGRSEDGQLRESPGITFYLLLDGCSLALPPTTPTP